MDVNKQLPLTQPPFNFPESDVNKNGELKPVRGRVLKRLLKYEYRAISTVLFIFMSSLLALSVLIAVQLHLYAQRNPLVLDEDGDMSWFLVLSIILAIYLNAAMLIASLVVPSQRYRKNFFKDEGYLTFSIPASPHEQILAKHISAFLSYIAAVCTCAISVLIIISSIDGVTGFPELPPIFTSESLTAAEIVEWIIVAIEIFLIGLLIPMLFCTLDGASAWWEQRLPEKHRRWIIALIVLGAISVLETAFTFSLTSGFVQDFFSLPKTLLLFIVVLILAVITYGLYAYEVRSFKKNINLK